MRTLVVFLGFLTYATACEAIRPPACEAGPDAAMIFIGTSLGPSKNGDGYAFRIDEPLKGIAPETKEVIVGAAACSEGYKAGERYLMLANRREFEGHTFFSSTPYSIDDSSEALALFRLHARDQHATLIYGRIAENIEDSLVRFTLDFKERPALSGVELTLTKGTERLTTISDAAGRFSFPLQESGSYQVTAKFPGHSSSQTNYKLDVAPDACRELNFAMWTDSRVTGHVAKPDGKPAANLPVDLSPSDPNNRFRPTVKTDVNGKFEFEKIPSGEYVIGVNTLGLNSKLPLEPVFYPGVKTKASAQIVKIVGAQTIENLDFQIGTPKPTRSIVIAVQWPDGSPVINASVSCRTTRTPPRGDQLDAIHLYVDLEGEATCEMLADQEYQVEADRLSWEHSSRPIQPIATRPKEAVAAGTFAVRLKIIIDASNDISATEKPTNMVKYNGH